MHRSTSSRWSVLCQRVLACELLTPAFKLTCMYAYHDVHRAQAHACSSDRIPRACTSVGVGSTIGLRGKTARSTMFAKCGDRQLFLTSMKAFINMIVICISFSSLPKINERFLLLMFGSSLNVRRPFAFFKARWHTRNLEGVHTYSSRLECYPIVVRSFAISMLDFGFNF